MGFSAPDHPTAVTFDTVLLSAQEQGRTIVTENVKDFRPLLIHRSQEAGPSMLFTSSRSFPRSRRNLEVLIDALDHWLNMPEADARPPEDRLAPTPTGSENPG